MKKFKNIFPVFILTIFICVTLFIISCDNYKSEEFEISGIDSKACQQLKRADSLGVDTVITVLLADFDSTWVDSVLYNPVTKSYGQVSAILDSLISNDIAVTNTADNKIKLITIANADTNYVALQSSSSSLTFFFDQSVSINLINTNGDVTTVSDKTMPLETAAGCTKLNAQDIEVPLIQSRYTIGVPSNPALLQVIKNEQTELRTIHVSIL